MKNKFAIAILAVFVLLSAGLHILEHYKPAYEYAVLETGNVIMLILCLGAYMIVKKQTGKTPGAFVRGITGASFLKLMVCMVAVLVYVLINREHIHKPTVFVLMG